MERNFWPVLVAILLTAIVVGGFVWFVMNSRVQAAEQANNSAQQQISRLQTEVDQLKSSGTSNAQTAALQTQVNDLKTQNQNLQNQVNQLQEQQKNMVIDRDGDGR